MTDHEQLVQRFVDQELSHEERVRFIARLGWDDALRQRVIALEQVVLDAGRLPRPSVPPGFVDGVLARAVPVHATPWSRLTGLLLAPRTLRWNLASAVAAGLIVAVAAGILATRTSGRTGGAAGPTTAGIELAKPVLVRLVVVQPGANTVEVAGDFNGWDPGRTPLEPAPGGAWTVTLPLEPGRYEYMFVIDGKNWVIDPFAVEQSDDGFGARNAIIDVRPPRGSV